MKANKVKTSVKDVKKKTKRVVKKQLETTISDKFFEAMNSLGHDAENFSKEIKKTSKALARKIAGKYNDVKNAVEDKLEAKPKSLKPKKVISKTAVSAAKSVESAIKKAEKVIARVSKTALKTKMPRLVTAGTSSAKAVVSKPRVKTQKSTSTPAASKSTAKSASIAPNVKASGVKKPGSKPAKAIASTKPGETKIPDPTDKI
jgi:hypothetical protein